MDVTFAAPWWLLGLVGLPLAWMLGMGLRRPLGRRRALWVTGLRTVALGLLVVALAGPSLVAGGRGVDVAFVVDGSDSMEAVQEAAQEWIGSAQATRGSGDRAAVTRFGLDAQIEYSLTSDPPPPDFNTIVAGGGTDIARGLRLGQGVLGTQQHRRLVLLSDGRATQGDAERTAAELAEAGVTVDVVQVGGASAADVLVESVAAPGRVNQGESYDLVATLRNTGSASVAATVITRRNGAEVDRADLQLPPGQTIHTLEHVAEDTGATRWEVEVLDPLDTVDANDVGRAGVLVDGPARVLVVTGTDGAEAQLVDALRAANLPTEVTPATSLPASDQLLENDAIVLVDVPAHAFDEADMVALDTFVRDAGHGLVIIGGPQTFGAGQWQDTPLEDLSPVFAEVQDPQTRPMVAEALVVDVSGSMAACHCREGQFGGVPGGANGEGGVNKTDITKEAVSRAIDALSSQDTVGVLAFNDSAEWVLPLQQAPSAAVVDDAAARLRPDGATNVVPAIEQAIDGLLDVNAQLRHIVLFTDGFSEDPQLLAVAEQALAEGITLSVVGTGEVPANPRTGNILERMAEVGGGRYYPGRDLSSIPDILVSEVQQVARPYIQEGDFQPVRGGADPVADQLDAVPGLLGYLATTSKPTASTSLRVGEFNDPLLARWQVGLGTTVAWTSDAQSVWASPWVAWDGYGTFFADLVASTFPRSGGGEGLVASAVAGTDGIEVVVTADEVLADGAVATATVVAPDGDRTQVPLERTGTTTWEAVIPGSQEGVTTLAVTIAGDGATELTTTTTAIRSYSAEYLPRDDDAGMLAAIAAAGGGRVDPDPTTVFAAAGLAPGSAATSLWPLLVLLALVTVPIEIGVRRLRLRRGDFRRRPPTSSDAATPSLATTLADVVRPTSVASDAASGAATSAETAPVTADDDVGTDARTRRRIAWDDQGRSLPPTPPSSTTPDPSTPPQPPGDPTSSSAATTPPASAAPATPSRPTPTPPVPPAGDADAEPPPPARRGPNPDAPGTSAARRLLDRRQQD